MSNDIISIIIPCYNDNDIVSRAVRSALAQSYGQRHPVEIIVVDDGSTEPVRNEYGAAVQIIRHPVNMGLSAALNTGIASSKGSRFVILAADDELHRDHLTITSRVQRDVVSCDMQVNGKTINGTEGTLSKLVEANCHSYAALIRKSTWELTGGFKTTMNPSWEDWEFFISAAKLGATAAHIHQPLHIYHRNPSGRDASAQGKERLLWGKLQGYHQDLYGKGRGVVTFVIPCYKHEKYVAAAVQSALLQVYPHVNVVVVDDASPGNVAEALKEFASDPRVTLMRHGVNKHLSASRNTGIVYALTTYGSQYLVMLDADDMVEPLYVEETMAAMPMDTKEYIYTDLAFIGDAWHPLAMEEFNCERLTKKHLHPCTFLMQSQQWQDIARRGNGYDETMKQGYEDWEFALASVEAGWCGKRLPKVLFKYRYHQHGSMRTSAKKVSGRLSSYIHSRHAWMNDKQRRAEMCLTCGGMGKFTGTRMMGAKSAGSFFVQGIGNVAGDVMVKVTYTGSTTSTMTKIGAHNQVYKYSGDPTKQKKGYGPEFSVYARDIHLFIGPFAYARLTPAAAEPAPVAATQVVELPKPKDAALEIDQMPIKAPQPLIDDDQLRPMEKAPASEPPAEEGADKGIEYKPEDFTQVAGVTAAMQPLLEAAGITVYEDLAEIAPEELAMILKPAKVTKAAAKKIVDAANEYLKQLSQGPANNAS